MELGILILIILGSFIFKTGKSNEESPQKPVPSKDMTWEEMEEYYGITLSRNPVESVKVDPDVTTETTLEESLTTCKTVNADMYEAPVVSNSDDAEAIHGAVHERTETIRREFTGKPMEEVRNEEPCYHRNSRSESLRLAARRGMVWFMILEESKGVRMLRRHNR